MRWLAKKLLPLILLIALSQSHASPLFEDDAVIEVELAGPLYSSIKSKADRRELPFALKANGIEHQIKVQVRGKSRARLCRFPPLRLNFTKDDTEQSVFRDQDKLRLVTHCRTGNAAQLDVLDEYAAYRIFSLISDIGYRVRLLHITYTDTDGRLKDTTFSRFGFLIESATELAGRAGGKRVHLANVNLSSLNDQQAASVYVFQYLIGNTDWSLVTADGEEFCCHNINIFDIGAELYIVPYDFDLAGLVNARYARPDPSLGISKVTQRRYRGFCTPSAALNEAVSAIRVKRVDILNLIDQIPGFSPKDIEVKRGYLEAFFARADKQDALIRNFEKRCL